MNLSLRKEAPSVTVPYCEATRDEPPSFIPRLDCKGKRASVGRVLHPPKTTTRLAGTKADKGWLSGEAASAGAAEEASGEQVWQF